MACGYASSASHGNSKPGGANCAGKITGTGFIFSAECCRMAWWKTLDRQFKPYVTHAVASDGISGQMLSRLSQKMMMM